MGYQWMIAVAALSVGLTTGCAPGGTDSNEASGDAGLSGGGGTGGTSGGEGGVQTVQGSPIASAADYQRQMATVVCAALATCCSEEGITVSAAQCEAMVNSGAETEAELQYDPDAAGDCLATARTIDGCGALDEPAVCERVFTGSQAIGEACTQDVECAPIEGGTATCGFDDVCEGEVRGVEGQSCSSSCTEAVEGGFTSTTCSGRGVDPEPGAPKVSCFSNDGFFCGPEDTCVAMVLQGEDCSDGGRCVAGLECRYDEAEARLCLPLPVLGESCSGECAGSFCLRGDDGSLCTAFTELGGACDPESFDNLCGPEAQCSEEAVCEAGSENNPAAFMCALLAGEF